MKYTTLAVLSSVFAVTEAVTGQLGDAPAITNNPAYASYEANLGNNNPRGIKGYIQAATDQGGAVIYHVNFSNLPTSGGPFMYHLHVDPVPDDGNCTKTLAHLDPFIRGEADPCDPAYPATCQVGDLSGKHGAIANTTSFQATFVDPYATLIPGLGSFFGNRSFVLHFANKTRIGCANFISTAGANYTAPAPVSSSSRPVPAPSAPAAGSSAPATPKFVLPNAPGYAGGASAGYQGNVNAPTEGNTAFLPNNGLSPGGSSSSSSGSGGSSSGNTASTPGKSTNGTAYFTGAATTLSTGSWSVVAVAALAAVFAVGL